MQRALRSMPNSSGGTPITRARASFLVETIVTSWSCGAIGTGGLAIRAGTDRFSAVLYDFHLSVRGRYFLRQRSKLLISQIEIGLPLFTLALVPKDFHNANLLQQRILDEGVEHHKTGVLLHEHMIDVIGL